MKRHPAFRFAYRIAVGVVGLTVVVLGIILVPLPGPGWAVIFVGLGIWATEFDWARALLVKVRAHYRRVTAWIGAQGLWVQAVGAVFSVAFTVATLWLMGVLGYLSGLVGFDHAILKSPLA